MALEPGCPVDDIDLMVGCRTGLPRASDLDDARAAGTPWSGALTRGNRTPVERLLAQSRVVRLERGHTGARTSTVSPFAIVALMLPSRRTAIAVAGCERVTAGGVIHPRLTQCLNGFEIDGKDGSSGALQDALSSGPGGGTTRAMDDSRCIHPPSCTSSPSCWRCVKMTLL